MEQLKQIAQCWGIDNDCDIKQIYGSAWEIDCKFILKTVDNLPDLEKSIRLSSLLKSCGLPVPTYVNTVGGLTYLAHDNGKYYCLMEKITGVHLSLYEHPDMAVEIGRIIGNLHHAFEKVSSQICVRENNLVNELDEYILPGIHKHNIKIPQQILDTIAQAVKKNDSVLPKQLIHRDPHMGNLLFDNGKLTGYIDFDISQSNVKVFDIAYFVVSLLVGNYNDPQKLKLWYRIYADIVSGYREANVLSEQEILILPSLFMFIELLFVSFFAQTGNNELSNSAYGMLLWLYENRDNFLLEY